MSHHRAGGHCMQSSNLGKKYETATPYPFHGFDLRRQRDTINGDGRIRTAIYLYCGKKKLDKVQIVGDQKTPFEEKVLKKAAGLVTKNRHAILSLVREGKYTNLTLDGYYYLVGTIVASQKNWVRNAITYRDNWDNVLCAQVGDMLLTDKDLLAKLEKTPALSENKLGHREISEEECQYRRFLGGLLECAEQNALIEAGIANALTKNAKTHESTTALRMLAKHSYANNEFSVFVKNCLEWPDTQIARAILLRALSGMTIESVCGLDIADIQRYSFPFDAGGKITWLRVVKEYNQSRNALPNMTYILEDAFSYRYLPCTDVMVQLLKRQTAYRKREGSGLEDDAPLFTGADGKRLTPAEAKVVEEQLIEQSIRSPINLPIGRGSKKGRFRGDFLRANAHFHFRYDALLDDQETAVLLGIKPTQVYATNYVDWRYLYILMALRAKMERWHGQLLTVRNTNPRICVIKPLSSTLPRKKILSSRCAARTASR